MRLLFTLVTTLSLTTYASAQVKELGVKTGITNSLIKINEYDPNNSGVAKKYNTSNGQSFYVQAFAQVYHYKNFSLQGGIGMIEKSSDYTYKVRIGNTSDSAQINTLLETRSFFLEANTKTKILIPEAPSVIPYFLLGAQYLMQNKQTNTIPFTLQENQIQGVIGVGADIDVKKLHFFIEYNRFLSFNRNYSQDSNYDYFEKSGAFLIGMKFILKPQKNK